MFPNDGWYNKIIIEIYQVQYVNVHNSIEDKGMVASKTKLLFRASVPITLFIFYGQYTNIALVLKFAYLQIWKYFCSI